MRVIKSAPPKQHRANLHTSRPPPGRFDSTVRQLTLPWGLHLQRGQNGKGAQPPRSCTHPSAPRRRVCREPTWCSSLGREAATDRESQRWLLAQLRTRVPAVPAGRSSGDCGCGAGEAPYLLLTTWPDPSTNQRPAGASPLREYVTAVVLS